MTRSNLWRIKTIVRHAQTFAFICLALVPIHTFTQDDATTIRIGSAAAALFSLSNAWRVREPDPVVWDPVSLRVFVLMTTMGLGLLGIGNVVWASLGLLQALVLVLLTPSAGIFSNASGRWVAVRVHRLSPTRPCDGAPRTGDTARWEPYHLSGRELLSTVSPKAASRPPKPSLDDDAVRPIAT